MRKPTSSTLSTTKSTTTIKTTTPCCTKVGLKRGPWTPEEDKVLSDFINKDGEGRWRTLPKRAGLLRCGKSCRLRWMNYLRPSVKRGQIAPDEEDLILRLHRLLGNRWSLIAGRIPGRTDNEIKNYWNTHLSKKLIRQGIDPRTHKPLSNATTTTDDHQLMVSATAAHSDHIHNDASNLPLVNRRGSATTAGPDNISATGLVEHHVSDGSPPRLVHSYTADDDDHFQAMIDNVTSVAGGHGNTSFLNLSHNNGDNHDQRDDEMNYSCGGEDVFSSFLNSLINEDDQVFINTGQMIQHSHNNQLMQANHHHDHQPILSDITVPLANESDGSFGFVNGNACADINGNWGITAATLSASGNAVFGEQNCGRRFTNEHDDQRQF